MHPDLGLTGLQGGLFLEITVLGCWAPYPRAGGACSGYLLRGGGRNILLEAGNGSLSKLMAFLDFRRLDAVIISHLHPDHFLDLFPLRHAIEGARREGSRTEPLDLFLPARPDQIFQVLAGYKKAFNPVPIEEIPLEENLPGIPVRRLDLGGLSIRFVPSRHSLPGYIISFTGAGKLVFSGDTGPCDAFWQAVNDIDNLRHLIIECAFPDREEALAIASRHLCPRQLALELRKLERPCDIHITHLKPGQMELTMAEIERSLGEFRPQLLRHKQVFEF
ncbi:MAG: ribonuclease Z [Planctomycetes bacterium ADurb.Bin412]|nr:MAG: ribonuclease Z [Planctomycetes bacterium ADurb.Bin412]